MISDHPLTQREFMRKFSDVARPDFNPDFFKRENKSIFDEMKKIILSCEREQYFTLKVISFREITNYGDVRKTLYNHEEERRAMKVKPAKVENPYHNIDIKDSDLMLLEVIYYIRINGEKPEEDHLKVIIELPRFVNKYYFRLNGNYFAPVFQVVDRSTYNNSNTTAAKCPIVTLRTQFMTIRMLKIAEELTDYMSGNRIPTVNYEAYIFSKKVKAHKYLLAKYGLVGAMVFLGIEKQVFLSTTPDTRADFYCFQKGEIFVSTPKVLFDNDFVIQSFVCTVHDSIPETVDKKTVTKKKKEEELFKVSLYDRLFDPRFWVAQLGSIYRDKDSPVNKGIAVLNSLENIYDITSRDIILLPEEAKATAYHALRWLMREFNKIRNKDNLDLAFKRIRMSEYIASLYAIKLSKGIYRISDEGKHVTLKMVKSAIYTQPNYILTVINSSKLVNFADIPNDNDAVMALNCTFKGISGLGEEGKVQNAYRRLHPSHIGRFDLDSSSASDPGLTMVAAPYGKLYNNGLFSDIQEPNSWEEEYQRMVDEYNNLVGMKEVITLQKKCGFEYDDIKDQILEESIKNYKKLICPVSDINGQIDYSNPIVDDEL